MNFARRHVPAILGATAAAGLAVLSIAPMAAATAAPRRAQHPAPTFTVAQILNGSSLTHTFTPAGGTPQTTPLSFPDDITTMGGRLFTAFQNGVGPQGQAAPNGNRDSTVVEFTTAGKVIRQWDVLGKCDGLTADPRTHLVIATVNEDAHSSVYTINPGRLVPKGRQIVHYRYSRPLPGKGGTDAISIYRGMVLISASAPGTTGAPAPQRRYPAVYIAVFHRIGRVAVIRPLFFDESAAVTVNRQNPSEHVRLALTDPDSNEVVPFSARRFGGTFMLTSQGDQEQIFVRHAGTPRQRLFVLSLTHSVDDTAWPTSRHGALFTTDNSGDTVNMVTGRFPVGEPFVAVTPCDENSAPATCPALPAYPPNYLGMVNPFTGVITAVPLTGPAVEPQGMLFLRRR
jgi:hypothetical protein